MLKKLSKFKILSLVFGLCFLVSCQEMSMEERVRMVKENPEKFSSSHYKDDWGKKKEYYKQLFPIGTPKEFVDKALIDGGGLRSYLATPAYPTVYGYKRPSGWFLPSNAPINFIFNENLKLENIRTGAGYFFEEGKKIEDLFPKTQELPKEG